MLPRLATLTLLLLPAAAGAHALAHEVEQRGAAYAVRVRVAGGAPLSRAAFRVAATAAPERVYAEGQTDAEGWAVFVPDAPGTWRVRIADATGHGARVDVEVPSSRGDAAGASLAGSARAEGGPPAPAPPAQPASQPSSRPPLRTLAGAALLLLVFAALRAIQLRRRPGR